MAEHNATLSSIGGYLAEASRPPLDSPEAEVLDASAVPAVIADRATGGFPSA